MMPQQPSLAPRWIALALGLCVGLGAVGIWRRAIDPVFFDTATGALPRSGAGEIIRDFAGARLGDNRGRP